MAGYYTVQSDSDLLTVTITINALHPNDRILNRRRLPRYKLVRMICCTSTKSARYVQIHFRIQANEVIVAW